MQDELSTLMTKVKDVISENETLSEHAKYGQDESDIEETASYKPYKPTKFSAASGPNILFESRISELEAQLTQMGIDYKKLSDENAEMKRKRAQGGDSYLDSSCSDAYKKQIENLQRDKAALEETIKKLQKQVTEMKEFDVQVFTKSQRNRDLVDQAHIEKSHADIEIRRLKVLTIILFYK
jgi:serologically defined colon cancer antigen 8